MRPRPTLATSIVDRLFGRFGRVIFRIGRATGWRGQRVRSHLAGKGGRR